MFDRSALKKKAMKKESDELRRREAEARRAAMAAKIAVDLDKASVAALLAGGPTFEAWSLICCLCLRAVARLPPELTV